jgi:hypothetical protein
LDAKISVEDNQVMVEEDRRKVEVLFTGEAFRKACLTPHLMSNQLTPLKIFSTFVLFYSLVHKKENCKVFLMEELEAHLYPTL